MAKKWVVNLRAQLRIVVVLSWSTFFCNGSMDHSKTVSNLLQFLKRYCVHCVMRSSSSASSFHHFPSFQKRLAQLSAQSIEFSIRLICLILLPSFSHSFRMSDCLPLGKCLQVSDKSSLRALTHCTAFILRHPSLPPTASRHRHRVGSNAQTDS